VVVVLVACAVLCGSAVAQRPMRGRGGLSAAEEESSWTLQARHVAGKLGLAEDTTGKLVAAYKEARKAYQEALRAGMEKLRETAGDDRRARMIGFREQREKAADTARAEFKKAVSAFLDEAQTGMAVARLGVLSEQWDRMVATLAGFELGEKLAAAMEHVNNYIVQQAKAMEDMWREDADRAALREKLQNMRTKLDEELAKLLSEDQLAKWKEATTWGGRRQGRGPAAGGMRRGPGQGAGSSATPSEE